jgi:hypothetical protein
VRTSEAAGSDSEVAVEAAESGLVVLVVVDQLMSDLLERYDDLWTGGFRRLLDEGLVFTEASHAHAFTETAAGHATLATGVLPRRHGIVANDWSEVDSSGATRSVYSVEDLSVSVLDAPSEEGRSPENMLRSGLASWVRAANPEARVVSVSRKDRAAVTMAGPVESAHVYWISDQTGRLVTSSWYRDAYPEWVDAVNREVLPGIFADTVWESGVPAEARGRTRPDTAETEGLAGWSWFPHRAHAELQNPTVPEINDWVIYTPGPDEAVLSLALEAIEVLELGRGEGPDFLAVGFSQVDYVGHRFGPRSREQLDNLLRLDRRIGRLLDALDREVGEGRWSLAFSADHGVLPYPEELRAEGKWAMRLSRQDHRSFLGSLRAAAGESESDADVPAAVARLAESYDFVARAYTHDELRNGPVTDTFIPLYRNAFVEGRYPGPVSSLGVELRFQEGLLTGHPARGTTHGSPYWYDRHVPLIFLGAGVGAGRSDQAAHTYDLAPTLARIAGISVPSDLDGRSLVPSLDSR